MNKPTCFVVMGFGVKTDYATGRKIDLDRSYRELIKPVVESKGLVCLRSDEIITFFSHEMPMYKELLKSELVIADLSTANPNVFYQLGIRHALRPKNTVVIAEQGLSYPFDQNHTKITTYSAIYDQIDYMEVLRFQKQLSEVIDAVLLNEQVDSPVYTFLDGLIPPSLQSPLEAVLSQEGDVAQEKEATGDEKDSNLSSLVSDAEVALRDKDFSRAKELLSHASTLSNDSYIIQRLVLATYKAEFPNELKALLEARKLLNTLTPLTSNDSESLQLLGEIEFRLFHNTSDFDRLVRARQAYEKLYTILPNFSTGMDLAYIVALQVPYRSDFSEKVADIVYYRRLIYEVIEHCKGKLHQIHVVKELDNNIIIPNNLSKLKDDLFLVQSILAEAYFAIDQMDKYKSAWNDAILLEFTAALLEHRENQIHRWNDLKGQSGLLSLLTSIEEQRGEDRKKKNLHLNKEKNLIFFSYSHKDIKWLNEFKKTLFPAFVGQEISLWDDKQIKPSEEYRKEIQNAINRSKAAVLLVSRDFLFSDFINKNELPPLLERAEKNGVSILWIALEESLYEDTEIEKYQCLNNPHQPLSKIKKENLDSEIVAISKKIRNYILPRNYEKH